MDTRIQTVLNAIDKANAADPNLEDGRPSALLYGERMSAELQRLFPDAGAPLQIAARGQHVERWKLARSTFPEGRESYLAWRKAQAEHHAQVVAQIMFSAGYDEDSIEAAGRMLRKQGIKRDDDVQALEDVICFVFLKWYFAPFAEKHSDEKIQRIVAKTARKMSKDARIRVLREFDLPAHLADAFQT